MHIGRAPGRCEAEASGRLVWEKGQVTHCCCKGYEQVWEAEIQGWQVLLFVWWIVGHNLHVLSWLSLRKCFVTQPLYIIGQWPSCKIWSILTGSFSQVYICWSWEVPKLIIFEGPTGDGITSISFPNTAGSLPCFRYALQQSIEKFWSLNSSWLLEACCSSTWSITTLCSTTGTRSTIGRRIQGCLKIVICRRI